MLLPFVFAGTTLLALALVLGPLLRPEPAPASRAACNEAVYRDQLEELERDVARGIVRRHEAAGARLELQRRLLAAANDEEPAVAAARRPLLAVGVALLVAVSAAAVYLRVGSPGLPDDPYAARANERLAAAQQQAQLAQIRGMVDRLAGQMTRKPDDLAGWLRLGRAYAVLGDTGRAAGAFANAERLKPDDPGVLLAEAQALLLRHPTSGPIPRPVIANLQRIRAVAPGQPFALWYLGLDAAQRGDFATARQDWRQVLAAMPPDGNERKTVAAALDGIRGK